MTDDRTTRVGTTDDQAGRISAPGVDDPGSGDPGSGDPRATTPSHSRRRRLTVIALLGVVVVMAVVLWWFEPQALFIDDVVDEEFPSGSDSAEAADTDPAAGEPAPDPDTDPAAGEPAPDPDTDPAAGEATPRSEAGAEGAGDGSTAASDPVALRSGSFSSRNRYEVTGTATAFALDAGDDPDRVLRLEDFASTNGPDLFVYLTRADAAAADGELDADFVDLGVLTGNVGNQNYVIPAEVDLDVYDTVVIWCRRFTTSFGVADLSPTNG